MDIVKFLLDNSFENYEICKAILEVDSWGVSPLYAAALAGQLDIVRAFVAAIAAVPEDVVECSACDMDNSSMLHLVQNPDVLAVLLAAPSNFGPCGRTYVDFSKDGETPLLAALRCGYTEVMHSTLLPPASSDTSAPMTALSTSNLLALKAS